MMNLSSNSFTSWCNIWCGLYRLNKDVRCRFTLWCCDIDFHGRVPTTVKNFTSTNLGNTRHVCCTIKQQIQCNLDFKTLKNGTPLKHSFCSVLLVISGRQDVSKCRTIYQCKGGKINGISQLSRWSTVQLKQDFLCHKSPIKQTFLKLTLARHAWNSTYD